MKINLNDRVRVVLTEAGADTWNSYYDQFKKYRVSSSKEEDDEIREQLWHIMEVFGPSVHLGMKAPFVCCEMEIV